VIDLTGSAAPVVVPAATRASQWTSGPVARGRALFHATDDLRISADGRACASCHPDGRDDGLTWSTPDGPRQTPSLAGRVSGTAPYGWFGSSGTVRGHLEHTFGRLQGRGFARSEDAADLAALMAYLGAMRAPDRDAVPHASPRAELVAAGRALFFEARQGCAACHDGGGSDGARHDVGSGNVDERSLRFDTPSLIGIASSAPYFHDGRYATLEDMLATSDGRMGHTLHLSRADMRALVAFMETL
jgi:cytochrome c peroxidase